MFKYSATITFNLTVQASAGSFPVQVTLAGRQSKVIVTDFAFGSSRALYSTAAVYFAGKLSGRDVLFLHGDIGVQHSVALKLPGPVTVGGSKIAATSSGPSGYTVITFKPTAEGLTAVSSGPTGPLLLFATPATVATYWQPTVSTGSGNFWSLDTNSTLLVGGPYLVRSAKVKGSTVALTGDLNQDTVISLYGAPKDAKVTWNGKSISVSASTIVHGLVEGKATVSKGQVNVPSLSNWKYSDR